MAGRNDPVIVFLSAVGAVVLAGDAPSAVETRFRQDSFLCHRPPRETCAYRTTPSVGLLAAAYGSTGMRPARYALRPASIPSRMASAIRAGLFARAIAVLIRQASAPSSIA